MRIVLIQSAPYLPSYGGANKSNRLLLEALAGKGHDCRAVAPAAATRVVGASDAAAKELSSRGIKVQSGPDGITSFRHNGVHVTLVRDYAGLRRQVVRVIERTSPTWILASSEDPGQMLMAAALTVAPDRVIYLARTTAALPCGPDAVVRSEANTALLRRARASVAVSHYLREYLQRWAGVRAEVLPISLQPPGPYPDHGRHPGPFVTMVNPCAMKGISIFLELTERMPDVAFAAVPTWGTTHADRTQLARRPNVLVLPPSDDIDAVLSQTRTLLMPSLWAEAKGRIILEALLRGVPVLASDVGGIREAMLGVEHVLPINPIVEYAGTLDDGGLPVAVVPAQDVAPWQAALQRVLGEPEHYADLSRRSRASALAHVAELVIDPLEARLTALAFERRPPPATETQPAPAAAAAPLGELETRSAERRTLIALRARQ